MATEYISRAWKIYKKNTLSFIGSELIAMLLSGLLIFLGILIFMSSILPALNMDILVTKDKEVLRQYIMETFNKPGFLRSFGTGLLGLIIFIIMGVLVSLYLTIGKYGMSYESLRRRTKISTMFKVSRKLGFRWIITSFLLFILGFIVLIPILIIGIFTLGIGFVVVPLIAPVLTLIAPAMVVDNVSPINSIKRAFMVAKKNYLSLFVLWLSYAAISIFISLIGGFLSSIPFIGGLINLFTSLLTWFVINPMSKISFVNFYSKTVKRT